MFVAAEFVNHEELESLEDRLIGYIEVAVQKTVRESERRVRREIETLREDFTAFRNRHDVEMAQVHTELGQIHGEIARINEILMWIVQRLPPEPLGPPPAQFVRHDEEQQK